VTELLLNVAVVVPALIALRWLSQNRAGTRIESWGALGICLVTALGVFALSEPPNLFEDFEQHYYIGGKAALEAPAALGPLVERGVEDGFTNLPIVAYLFFPLATLPVNVATLIFTLVGLAMTFAAWLLLVRLANLEGSARWWLLFLFAASGPLHYSVREGNTSHVVLLAVAAALYFLRSSKPIIAGALLGLAAVIKLPLLLFGVYFVLRRNWRSAIGFASICVASVLLSVLVFGWELNQRWLESVQQYSREPLGAFNVQSIPALLVRVAGGPEVLRDFTPHSTGTTQQLVGSFIVGLLYVAALYACWKHTGAAAVVAPGATDRKRELEFLLVLSLAVISSPLSWSHYYALLLMPMAFFLGSRLPLTRDPRLRRLGWVGIVLTVPVVTVLDLPGRPLTELYARVGVSHLLLGGLIWFALLAWARIREDGAPTRSQRHGEPEALGILD